MRYLVLLGLLSASLADDSPLLTEARAFRGLVEVRSSAHLLAGAEGTESQTETLRFVLFTKPPARAERGKPLPFEMRDREGQWSIRIDQREAGVSSKGSGDGALYPEVNGSVDPATGRVRIEISVSPARLVARTLLAGMVDGRPQTYRSAADRAAFSKGFEAEGAFDADGVFAGTRSHVDRKEKHPREVEITWRLERIDPILRGLALDQNGDPLAGLRVVARTTDPERIRKRLPPILVEGKTDERGRFALDAWPARWEIEIEGEVRRDEVVEGHHLREGLLLRTEEAPFTEARLNRYGLALLPEARLLRGAFREDLRGYFAYVRERGGEARLAAALVAPPGE